MHFDNGSCARSLGILYHSIKASSHIWSSFNRVGTVH